MPLQLSLVSAACAAVCWQSASLRQTAQQQTAATEMAAITVDSLDDGALEI